MKILVINLGMKSIRSIVFDAKGRKLGSSSIPIETYLNEEYVLQDPDEWWRKGARVVKESMIDLDKEDIDYITVTASSSCLICVDQNGKELYKSMMVSDKRARLEAESLNENPLFGKLHADGKGRADSSFMIPKIMWIKAHEPELYAKTYKFLSPNDYMIGRMTGEFKTDVFNAQKYYYDSKTGKYPEELLHDLEIDSTKLPEVDEPGTYVANLNEEAAAWLQLSVKTKVVLSSYDAICSFFGSGVSEEGEASDVSGTVTVFRTMTKRTDLKDTGKIFVSPYYSKGISIVGGSNNMGGGLIEWVKQCYYMNEPYPYEVMEKDATEARLGAGGLIFLPYLLGERAPIWNNNARGTFFGLERTHTRKEMTRAVFESTGFIDIDMIKAIEETGIEVKKIHFSGGLARVNLIAQIKADITGKEVDVLTEFETTATGAAMMVFVGMGVYRDYKEAADCFAKVRMTIHPNEDNHARYLQLYGLYKDTYDSLKDLYAKRMNIVKEVYPKHQVRIENL